AHFTSRCHLELGGRVEVASGVAYLRQCLGERSLRKAAIDLRVNRRDIVGEILLERLTILGAGVEPPDARHVPLARIVRARFAEFAEESVEVQPLAIAPLLEQ